MKKPLIAILMTAVFLISICGPLINMNVAAQPVQNDPVDWYMQENGQLASDYYSLYPYNKSSLKIGLSKYGEFIDNTTNVGLEYAGARDPWAPLAGMSMDDIFLPKDVWINGWYIDINYQHSTWGLRNLWAGAMFSDLSAYGGPWLHVDSTLGSYSESQESFSQPGYVIDGNNMVKWTGDPVDGGRKTNGTAVTDPISVLYDGPREFVAILMNHIYDVRASTNATLNIVDVMFTVIFNKVSKQIIVLKDIKITAQAKLILGSLKVRINVAGQPQQFDVPKGVLVQFSNREEWDLGATAPNTEIYSSYAHFYTEGTGPMWGSPENDTLAEGQPTVYNSLWTALPTIPANTSIVGGWQNTSAYGPAPTALHGDDTYDVAQIISNDKLYVGFAGYWPSLSDWSIDAGRREINPSSISAYGLASGRTLWTAPILGNESHDIDSMSNPNDEPFTSPVTVGEWDFMLSNQPRIVGPTSDPDLIKANIQFRGVAVYGVTDLHDASDEDFQTYQTPQPLDFIDREVRYQLDMHFNPYDLEQAIDKDTMRWVQKEWGDDDTTDFMLEYTYEYPARPYIDDSWPYVDASDFVGSQGLWDGANWNVVWTLWDSYNIYDTWDLSKGTPPEYEPIGSSFSERVLIDGILQKRDIDYILWTNASVVYDHDDTHYDHDGFMWINFTHAPAEDAEIKILFSTGWDNCGCGAGGSGTDLTDSYFDGSWEWGTVGRDAAGIDDLGLGMATEWAMGTSAPVKNTGFDMQDTSAPSAPYMLAPMRPALLQARSGYMDAGDMYSAANNTGRLALKDDWCMHEDGDWINGVPVASSNIIAVGGPYANAMSQYFNDFTSAFFTMNGGEGAWTPDLNNAGKIMPLTCWSLNRNDTNSYKVFHGYTPESVDGVQTIGYGVIATAKDLNGTVGLTVWGYSGQDTYFTSWALLHSDVLALAFQLMPPGVTSLILRFNYTLHPTDYCFVTIIEALGTISEYDAQSCFGVGPFVELSASDYGTTYGWPKYPLWVGKYPTIHIDP
jgi:hypothetical protein